MRRKGSRYQHTNTFSDEKSFSGFRERELTLAPGIVEHTLLHTDRLDQLADAYYKVDRRWWRILDANADFMYGFELIEKDTKNNDMYGNIISIPAARGKE